MTMTVKQKVAFEQSIKLLRDIAAVLRSLAEEFDSDQLETAADECLSQAANVEEVFHA